MHSSTYSIPPFSVLLSVYQKESPRLFDLSLESLVTQKLQASEVILVCDGPLTPELESVIEKVKTKLPLKLVRLNENVGFGKALQAGLLECSNEFIARADTDDISLPDRFEKQMKFMIENPDIDILGSSIYEFEGDPKNIYTEKRLPLKHNDIVSYAKWRNPINHMTVIFKKSAVLRAGNYSDYRYAQDYDLWVKMITTGSKFENMSEALVLVSAGTDLVSRRGGFKHFQNEFKMQKDFMKLGFLRPTHVLINTLIRLPVRLLPNNFRKMFYLKILRNSKLN